MNYKYVIDLDGTIYKNKVVFDEAVTFIDYLNKNNRDYIFLTNCPEKTPTELCTILNNIGIKTDLSKVVTSGIIAIEYLKKTSKGKSVYVIGSEGYKKLLLDSGFDIVKADEKIADIVLVGFDDKFDYEMLKYANYHVLNGAMFISTNDDESIPTPNGPIPHTGAILKAIETSSKKTAQILGKPSKICYEILCEMLDASRENLCMIGDRLDTDMMFAKNNDFKGYLVLTGLTSKEEALHNTNIYNKSFNNLLEVISFENAM